MFSTRSTQHTHPRRTLSVPLIGLIVVLFSALTGLGLLVRGQGGVVINSTVTSNPNLEDGLVLHYTFDGSDIDWSNSTAEIKDASGFGNDGDLLIARPTDANAGSIGQALAFETQNSITIAPAASLRPTNAVTVSCWVNMDSFPPELEYSYLVSHEYDFEGASYGLYYNGAQAYSGGQNFRFYVANVSTKVFSAAIPRDAVPLGTWVHLTGTYDGSYLKIYLNGQQYSSSVPHSDSIAYDISKGVIVGDYPNNYEILYLRDSLVDDVRIYNRALSAEEIKRLYELGATTHIATTITTNPDLESGLVGHWTFDGPHVDWDATTAEIRDRSANADHGDAVSMTPGTSVSPGVLGQGLYLDGSTTYVNLSSVSMTNFSGDFSFALWFKPIIEDSVEEMLISASGGNDGWNLYLGSDNLRFRYNRPIVADIYLVGPNVSDSEWHHAMIIRDATTASTSLYLDGEMVDTDIMPAGYFTTGSLTLGSTVITRRMKGSVDDLRIFNRMLSAEEIKRLYELGR